MRIPSIRWPSVQSLLRATVVALLAFTVLELIGADIAYAPF
jgi:hypothetical protein